MSRMIPHTAHRATQFTMHGTKNESLLMWIHELTQTAKGRHLLAGLATEMRTAAGWRAAWAMCTCTKRPSATFAMALTTASLAAPPERLATSSHTVWSEWRRSSTLTLSKPGQAVVWPPLRTRCTGAVPEWWSWRVGGCGLELQARPAGKARTGR